MRSVVIFSVISLVYLTKTVDSKIFERCELAKVLKSNHGLSNHEAAMFTCIAERQSNLDSSAVGSSWGAQFHGLFQLSDEYWCSAPSKGYVCGVTCDKFRDDDIRDDFTCARYSVYDEHQRLSGDGFNAWPSNSYCKTNIYEYLSCLNGDTSNFIGSSSSSINRPTTKTNQWWSSSQRPVQPQQQQGRTKVYDNCELAQDLAYKHDIPMDQVATWVCIAYHESRYNTSAVGHLNWDGSGDHGLFQISDLFWCGPGKACGLSCDDLHDDDIADDVRCVKQIHAEHTRLSGDGFTAWAVYPRCRGSVLSYIDGCFSDDQNSIVPVTTARPVRPRPAITAPPKPQFKVNSSPGKVYTKCELAQELYYKHDVPWDQIPTWICIAKQESGFNTSAIGRLNWDGSEDHGLFQISDLYWCTHGSSGKACGLSCEDLRDDDISDDVRCIKQIHVEHTRLSGNGFNAWTTYSRCRGDLSSYVDKCFNEEKTTVHPVRPRPAVTAPARPQIYRHQQTLVKNKPKGKVYTRCELAQELYYKYKLPLDQIPTWVCIANHESLFNTSAIGRLNWDGSEDHGLFQISDLYWCDNGNPGKACNLACTDLEDNDITDDVECIKQIYDEHTLISGDGFNAWTVYPRNCKDRSQNFVSDCFVETTTKTVTYTTTKRTTTTTKRPTTTTTTTTKRPSATTRKPVVPVRQNPNRIETITKKSLYSYYLNDFGKTSKSLPTFKPFGFQSRFKGEETSKTRSSVVDTTKAVTTKKPILVQKTKPTQSWKWSTKSTQNVPSSNQNLLQTKHSFSNITPRSTSTGATKSPSRKWGNSDQNEIQQTAESDNKPKNAYEYYVKYVLGGKHVTVAPFNFDYIKGLTKPTLRGFKE